MNELEFFIIIIIIWINGPSRLFHSFWAELNVIKWGDDGSSSEKQNNKKKKHLATRNRAGLEPRAVRWRAISALKISVLNHSAVVSPEWMNDWTNERTSERAKGRMFIFYFYFLFFFFFFFFFTFASLRNVWNKFKWVFVGVHRTYFKIFVTPSMRI